MRRTLLYPFLLVFCISCQLNKTKVKICTHSTSIIVIGDFTEKKKLWPLADPILELYQCKKHPDAECWFYMNIISDRKVNPSLVNHLAAASDMELDELEGDEQYRNREIIGFYAKVRRSIGSFYKQFDSSKSLSYSECWAVICSSLWKLSEDRSEKKYLMVFSDLMEKSNIFNAYSRLSHKDIQAVSDKLNKAYPLPKCLIGISVMVIYQPISRQDDNRFNVMVAVYRSLLEKKGARVIVQSNNSNYNFN